MNTPLRIGIEIGGTKQQIVTGDNQGNVIDRYRFNMEPNANAVDIQKKIEEELTKVIATHQPERIGVGFGGPVNIATGKVATSHQIEGWSGFPLSDWLNTLTELPVVIENDSNTAALAESLRGAGRGFNPAFYVNMGSGVGGGLVIDGEIYHGDTPGEVEFGHLRLTPDGITVEDQCSGWAVDKAIREAVTTNPDCLLGQIIGNKTVGEAKYLADALAQGDAVAQNILSSVTSNLAFALSHVTHLFHPQVIILGGGLSMVGVPLRKSIEKKLPQFLMGIYGNGPEIKLAELGADAVPVGALLL